MKTTYYFLYMMYVDNRLMTTEVHTMESDDLALKQAMIDAKQLMIGPHGSDGLVIASDNLSILEKFSLGAEVTSYLYEEGYEKFLCVMQEQHQFHGEMFL